MLTLTLGGQDVCAYSFCVCVVAQILAPAEKNDPRPEHLLSLKPNPGKVWPTAPLVPGLTWQMCQL